MTENQPTPLSAAQLRQRLERVTRIARRMGFVGRVAYRREFSKSGGAQYGVGQTSPQDLLVVYAEAFLRDADPEEFSLEAIIAHERGHQILRRTPRLSELFKAMMSVDADEILASLLGSLLASVPDDRQALFEKAISEVLARGVESQAASLWAYNLRLVLESLL